jgi:uncharacterized protein YjbJ (UPF0337 family)
VTVGPEQFRVTVLKDQVTSAPDLNMHGQEISQAHESALSHHHLEMNYTAIAVESGWASRPTVRRIHHQQKGTVMNINADQAKGKVKEAAGDLTGNDKLKNEGKADQRAGDAKEFVNDVADKAEEVVDKVKDAVHKD